MTIPLLARRQVVLLPFPFSDLSAQKLRPALVLANASRDDWVLCQITSKAYADARAVQIENADFVSGDLQLTSFARPTKLFTAHRSLVLTVAGELRPAAFERVLAVLVELFVDKRPEA